MKKFKIYIITCWNVLQHIPPIIVTIPYTIMYWLWIMSGSVVMVFGVYTFRLQYWLLPDCCKATLDKQLNQLESH